MTVGRIGKNKLKVILNSIESVDYFGDSDNINYSNPDTRYALRIILGMALMKSDFEFSGEKLYVEMYRSALNGFIIYYTKAPYSKRYKKKKNSEHLILLKFKDSEGAIVASKAFNEEKAHINSSLYKYSGNYYLIISYPTDSLLNYELITEFADYYTGLDTASAIVGEYGSSIIEENAIEKLAQCF